MKRRGRENGRCFRFVSRKERLLRLAAHPPAVAAAFRQLVLHAPRRPLAHHRHYIYQ